MYVWQSLFYFYQLQSLCYTHRAQVCSLCIGALFVVLFLIALDVKFGSFVKQFEIWTRRHLNFDNQQNSRLSSSSAHHNEIHVNP